MISICLPYHIVLLSSWDFKNPLSLLYIYYRPRLRMCARVKFTISFLSSTQIASCVSFSTANSIPLGSLCIITISSTCARVLHRGDPDDLYERIRSSRAATMLSSHLAHRRLVILNLHAGYVSISTRRIKALVSSLSRGKRYTIETLGSGERQCTRDSVREDPRSVS